MIVKNGKTISTIYKGNNAIEKIYKGTLVVYESFKKLIASGVPPLTLLNCKGVDLVDYKIYGDNVGDKTKNIVNWDLIDNKNISKITNGFYAETYAVGVLGNIIDHLKSVLKPDTTYTLSRIYDGIHDASNGLIAFRINNQNITIVKPNHGLNSGTFSLTQEQIDELTSIYMYFHTDGATITNLMLVEGEYTIETLPSYEPYGYKIPVISRGKNLINIPSLTSTTGNGTTIECNLTKPFVVSCQETPTSIVNSSGVETSIWRLEFRKADGTVTRLWDQHFRDPAQAHNLKISASKENPVISINYRGTYINEGQYKDIQIEYGETPTEFEPYIEPITTNIYLDEPLKENEYISYIENNLPNIPTHKDTTILEVDTNILPSNMEVVYYGKGNNILLNDTENIILNSILKTNTYIEKDMTDTEIEQKLDEIIGG